MKKQPNNWDSASIFYNSFQLNYFDYKQANNKYLLSLDDETITSFAGTMVDFSVKQYKRAIYMDIRQTYLLCLDTFFEIIYALLPIKSGKRNEGYLLMDDQIVEQVNRRKAYIKDLEKYLAKKPSNFDKLNCEVHYSNKINEYTCSVLQYLVYDGLFETEYENELQESIKGLWKTFSILGEEVIETRDELNSYKHGLRVLPFMNQLNIFKPGRKNEKVSLDISNSISFQTISNDKTTKTLHTISFDYERDIAMTNYVSLLLHNVIALRKRRYNSNREDLEIPVFILGPDGLKNSMERSPGQCNIKISMPNKNLFNAESNT